MQVNNKGLDPFNQSVIAVSEFVKFWACSWNTARIDSAELHASILEVSGWLRRSCPVWFAYFAKAALKIASKFEEAEVVLEVEDMFSCYARTLGVVSRGRKQIVWAKVRVPCYQLNTRCKSATQHWQRKTCGNHITDIQLSQLCAKERIYVALRCSGSCLQHILGQWRNFSPVSISEQWMWCDDKMYSGDAFG